MWRNTRFWTLSRATSILASLSWISWRSPMGWPQSMRFLAYSTESLRHSSMSPSDMAANPARSVTKLPLAESRPLPARLVLGLAQQVVAPRPGRR